jgi:hypothetical protein
VEVFDPASTRGASAVELSVMLRLTVSRPVCFGIKHPFGAYDQIFITCVTVTVLFLWGALSDKRTGPAQSESESYVTTDGQPASLLGGWDRNRLLEEFCFSYPW